MDRMEADQILYIPLCDAIGNHQFLSVFDNHDSKIWSASTACERDPSSLTAVFALSKIALFFLFHIHVWLWHKHDILPWHNRWDSGQLVAVARTGGVSCKVAAAAALQGCANGRIHRQSKQTAQEDSSLASHTSMQSQSVSVSWIQLWLVIAYPFMEFSYMISKCISRKIQQNETNADFLCRFHKLFEHNNYYSQHIKMPWPLNL